MGSRVIVLSDETREKLRRLVPDARWEVVGNAVPLPVLRYRPPERPARFLFLGELTRRKGAHDLVSAVGEASQNGFLGTVALAGAEREAGQRDEPCVISPDAKPTRA